MIVRNWRVRKNLNFFDSNTDKKYIMNVVLFISEEERQQFLNQTKKDLSTFLESLKN